MRKIRSAKVVRRKAKKRTGASTKTLSTRVGKLSFHHDFAHGYPTTDTVDRLYEERDFQRACQAYLWALPAVAFAQWRFGQQTFGASDSVVAAFLTFDEKLGILTPNATTPYYLAFVDLARGPVVVELPAGVRGGTLDAWQRTLPDAEKPARYLLVGPAEEPPADAVGFEVRRSPTFGVMLGLRITTTDPKEGEAQLAKLQIYPYAQRANPPPTKLVSPKGKKWPGIPERGMGYWKRLDEVIQREPIEERDRFFHEMLAPLGIEKGKPFKPTAKQRKALTEAALVGEAMAKAGTFERRLPGMMYRKDCRWHYALQLDADNPDEFWNLLNQRSAWFYEAYSAAPSMAPKRPGPSSAYLGAYMDKRGNWLDGGKSYRLRVPPNAPMKLFWSVTLYDVDTRSLVVNKQKVADKSSRMDLKKNPDGSVDIYCGPKAPIGIASNWIPTVPKRNWFAYFRLYEPTEAYFDRSWPLADFVEIT